MAVPDWSRRYERAWVGRVVAGVRLPPNLLAISPSDLWTMTGARRASYADRVDRVEHLLAGRGLDLLIVAMAVAAAALSDARSRLRPEGILLVVEAVAVGGVVLALLLRRAAPFLAPAGTWLASAGLSFLDGELIVHQPAVSIAGIVAAVLLGNQPGARRSWGAPGADLSA